MTCIACGADLTTGVERRTNTCQDCLDDLAAAGRGDA